MSLPVLHLITELEAGGAQSALLRLLEGLDRARFAPTVACYYNADGIAARKMRALGVEVIDLGMKQKYRVDAFARLAALVQARRPALLHTWMFHANVPGRIVGKALGVPVVISSERTMGAESALRYRLNAATSPLADAIVCVSDAVAGFARDVIGLPAEKLIVIPNGIDTSRVRQRGADQHPGAHPGLQRVELLYAGRLAPVKGVDVLLQAAVQLRRTSVETPWHLTILGDGEENTALRAFVNTNGLAEFVTFHPAQPDLMQRLASYDVLVLPSHWEGMPNVALEAMAARLPVVATAVGGTPEVVANGKTGLLVPPGEPAALAAALAAVVGSAELRRSLGEAGHARVQNEFTIASVVHRTETLYLRLLQRKGIPLAAGERS